jgi:predicted nucleic acid-binding protein
MNVIDSSAWLEYLADGPNTQFFAAAIEDTGALIVPTITIYEVFKRMLVQRGEGDALQAVAAMMEGQTVCLDEQLALEAAKISAELKLPMADSIMLATARAHRATLWTQDADCEGIEGVKYIAKQTA